MCASPVWLQEQRLRDLSSESCIFALSDARCICALLLNVSRAAGGIPELWQGYPVALLLRLCMLCAVTVARSHPRNVWECCSRSRSHRADSLPSTWECFTLLTSDISVWKSCQLTGTCFQLATPQLYEGREGEKSKLLVQNSPFSFCNLSKNRTAASCILYRISGAFIDVFLSVHKVDVEKNRQKHWVLSWAALTWILYMEVFTVPEKHSAVQNAINGI